MGPSLGTHRHTQVPVRSVRYRGRGYQRCKSLRPGKRPVTDYIYFICVLRCIQKYFTYTKPASVMVGENLVGVTYGYHQVSAHFRPEMKPTWNGLLVTPTTLVSAWWSLVQILQSSRLPVVSNIPIHRNKPDCLRGRVWFSKPLNLDTIVYE